MKKLIIFFMCAFFLIQTWVNIVDYSNKQLDFYGNYENKNFNAFIIPDIEEISYKDKLSKVLLETAMQTKTNIYRSTFVDGKKKGTYEIIKFVLLVTDSNYLKKYDIVSGKMLTIKETQSNDENIYVTSYEKSNVNKVGTINAKMMGRDITVRPMFQMFSYYKAGGLYYAETNKSISEFKKVLVENINKECKTNISISDLKSDSLVSGVPMKDTTLENIICIILAVFVILFFLYSILNGSKEIAVMKIMGNSSISILKKLYLKKFLIASVSMVILLVFNIYYTFSIKNTAILFLKFICMSSIIMSICIILFLFLTSGSSILNGLKGKKNTRLIFRFNFISQFMAIAILLYAGQGIYNDIGQMLKINAAYKNWNISSEYGVFYPYYIGKDMTGIERDITDKMINTKLYKSLNQDGSIYIDSRCYEKDYKKNISDKENINNSYKQSIVVNPNYLNLYKVMDADGNRVKIQENDRNVILLVPEKYKSKEADIKKYYMENHKDCALVDKENYGVKNNKHNNCKLNIIWIKNNQKIFTYDIEVDTIDNCVSDAIIKVITEKNSLISERNCINGNGSIDSLKIKLKGDSRQTYKNYQELLKNLNLDDNLKTIVSVNQDIQRIIAECKDNLRSTLFTMGIAVIMLSFLYIQGIMLNFEINKREYIIKKINGFSKMHIYYKYNIMQYITILIMIDIYLMIAGRSYLVYGFFVAFLLIVIQTMITGICTKRIESNNLVYVLKGE